jgi:hypothetical protein
MAVLKSGGKEAVTDYSTAESFGLLATLAECRLQTGRTHQIRVHMAHMAARLEFIHPTCENKVSLAAPPPPDMEKLIKVLRTSA